MGLFLMGSQNTRRIFKLNSPHPYEIHRNGGTRNSIILGNGNDSSKNIVTDDRKVEIGCEYAGDTKYIIHLWVYLAIFGLRFDSGMYFEVLPIFIRRL